MTISGTLAEKAEYKWQAFLKAGEAYGITIPEGAEFRQTAQHVFAFSDFVSATCIRHPDLLADLVHSGDLERRYPADEYGKTLKALLTGIEEEAALEKQLRHFRRREMVRIAWCDLCGLSDLFATMADLTALAEAVVDQTQALLYRWQCTTHGVPTGPRSTVGFAVRWHGERPAVLWEQQGPTQLLTAPAVDADWSSNAASGEALWSEPPQPKRIGVSIDLGDN